MLKKLNDKLSFFKENLHISLIIITMVFLLNFVIIFSYIGTTRILNRNIDNTAVAALDKSSQAIRNKLTECQLYIRLICDDMQSSDPYDKVLEDIYDHADKISGLYTGYYHGTYFEYKGNVYKSDPDMPDVTQMAWYAHCRENPDVAAVYIDEGDYITDSRIIIAMYDTTTQSLAAAIIDADVFAQYINNTDNINSMFSTVVIGKDNNLMYATDKGMLTDYAAFSASKSGAKLLKSISEHPKGESRFRLDGKTYLAYYSPFIADWNIMIYARQNTLFQSLYIFNMLQYLVLVIIFVLFIFFFIRSYKSSMRLERALKTRSAFLTNMSHEIRTPLNAIIGMSEILLRRDIHGAARNDVVAIHNAGTGLLAIINDILDYSKMESGSFNIINDEYDLPGLITEVVSLVSFRIKTKDVRLLVNINPAVPRRLIGDEVRIKQILVNLLGNAVKFTEHGYIILSVDWDFISDGETTLSLKVADTGIGIAEGEAQLLFDEFTQADAGAKSKHHGTGLGLYISRNLAAQMGGSISLESTLGKGSTFTATIKNKVKNYAPFAAVSDENIMLGIYERDITLAELLGVSLELLHVKYRIISDTSNISDFTDLTHIFFRQKWKNEVGRILGSLDLNPICILLTELNEDIEDSSLKKLMINLFGLQIADCLNGEIKYFDRYSGFDTGEIVTIPDARALIVDDNITNMAVAKGILAEYNIIIDTAVDGAQAIDMVKQNDYDIVFMDNMMPVMDGIEATKRIREMEGDYYKNLPIIALTALAGRGDRERFQSLGFDEFISKPIDLNKMDVILHKFLQNKIKDIYDISTANVENISIEQDLVIDTEAGIRQLGKNADSYADILTIYIQDMEKRYEQLINEHNIDKNTINFHAIKGSSANVGAYKLNEMAAEMEKLGKENDVQQVDAKLDQFLQLLDLTIQTAKDYLHDYKGMQNRSKGYKYAVERVYINDIINACENMDMIKIEDIYEIITHYVYPDPTMKLLEKIKLASFEYDYDKIVECAKKLMN